jgi:hypothetical protein
MEDIIDLLKEYFKKRDDVAFAFLYGSWAKGNATRLSDIDVAVYFYPKKRRPIEYEEEVFYDGEKEILTDLERLLKREVELLVLNRAPSYISASSIRGIPIVIKDFGLYLDFMLTVTDIGDDFEELIINDYLERSRLGKGN